MRLRHAVLALAILTAIAYGPSLANPFIWDDEQFVVRNETVQQFNFKQMFRESTTAGAGVLSNYFRPLTTLSFAIDAQLWGENPTGFRLTNLIMHFLAGVLLLLLLRQLKFGTIGSFWVSTFFLLHPVQTEAIVYISSRGDAQSALLLLSALYLFALSFQKHGWRTTIAETELLVRPPVLLFGSASLYIAAILAKELALAGIGLFALVWIFHIGSAWLQHPRSRLSSISKPYVTHLVVVLMLLVISLAYAVARQTVWNFHPTFDFAVFDATYADSVVVRLLTFTQAFPKYLQVFLVPFNLHMDHSMAVLTTAVSPWPWLSLTLLIGGFVLGWLEFRMLKSLWIWFGWLWFLSGLVPISGIIPVNGLFYEHWLYLPMVGLLIIVAQLARFVLRRFKLTVIYWLPSMLVVVYLILTIRQNYLWGNHIRFYEYTLQFTQSARLYNNLAMAYAEQGQLEAAIANYQRALQISNGYPQVFYNLANVLVAQGDTQAALSNYLQALTLDSAFVYAYLPAIQIAQQLEDQSSLQQIIDLAEQQSPEFATQVRNLVASPLQTE